MLGWLTKSDIPGRVTVCISLPNSETWQADFRGAFLSLTKSENWEEHDTLSPEEMADEWRSVFFDFLNGECSMIPIGTILAYGGVLAPEGFLLCHGQTVLRADYPLLFEVIGLYFGSYVDDDSFDIPDLRQKFPLGVHSSLGVPFEIGDNGGEINHTLTVGEMPSHTHRSKALGQPILNGPPYDTTPVGKGGVIQELGIIESTGGGSAHNNLPPYLALSFIIKY